MYAVYVISSAIFYSGMLHYPWNFSVRHQESSIPNEYSLSLIFKLPFSHGIHPVWFYFSPVSMRKPNCALAPCQYSPHPRQFQAVTIFSGVSLPANQSPCQTFISTVFTLSLGSLMSFQIKSGWHSSPGTRRAWHYLPLLRSKLISRF